MADDPPERLSFSIPPGSDLDAETIDEIVAESEYDTRSEYIREAILGDATDNS